MFTSTLISDREYTSVYALCDPIASEVRYVGKAKNPERRFKGHLEPRQLARVTHKNHWINSLLARGLTPELKILDRVPRMLENAAERRWIEVCRDRGCKLTNGTNGGDGGAMLPEIAKAGGLKRRGQKRTLETRARMSASHKLRYADPAARAKQREISLRLGMRPPPAVRGEANNKTNMLDAQVRELRERHAEGSTCWVLAEEYGITRASVTQLVTGQVRLEAGGPIREARRKPRLSAAQRQEIHDQVAKGNAPQTVAVAFGIDVSTVYKIIKRVAGNSISPNKEG